MEKLAAGFLFLTFIGFLSATACGNIGSINLNGNATATGNCFNITSSNVVVNCNGYAVIGNGSGDGFDVNNMSNVTITNCLVTGFTAGVNASEFNNLTISYSNFTGNVYSINTWTPSYKYWNASGSYWQYIAPPTGFIYSYGLNLFNNNFSDPFTFSDNPYSCNVVYNASIEGNSINGNFAGYHLSNSTISSNNFTGSGNLFGFNSTDAIYNGSSYANTYIWPYTNKNYFYQYGSNLNLGSYNNMTSNHFLNGNSTVFFISPCNYNYFSSNNFSGGAFTGQFWCDNNVQACASNGGWQADASTGNNTFDNNNFTRNNTESPFIGFFNYRNNMNYLFENVTANNWIDGKSVNYSSPWSNNICPSNTQLNFGNNQYGFVALVNCTNVTVNGTFYTGIGIGLVNNSLFNGSNVSGTSSMGLAFLSSNNDTVQNSNLTGNAVMLTTTSLTNWFNSYNDYYGLGMGMGDGFDVNNVANLSINNVFVNNFTVGVEYSQFNNLTISNSNFTGNNVSILQWNSPISFVDPLELTHSFVLSTGLNLSGDNFSDPTTLKVNPYQCEAIRYASFNNNNIAGTFFGHHIQNSSFSNNNISNGKGFGGGFTVDSFNNLSNNYFTNSTYEGSFLIGLAAYNYFYNNTFLGGLLYGNTWSSYNVSICISMQGWIGAPRGNNTFDNNNFTRTNLASPFLTLLTYDPMYFFENVTANNWIDGKSVNYSSPWSNNICPSNTQLNFGNNQYGFVALVNCTNVTVTGTFYTGLGVGFTNNSLFNSCNVSGTDNYGLFFDYSQNNTLQNSNVTSVGAQSLFLSKSNYNNILNDLILQEAWSTEIYLINSNYNLFGNLYDYGPNSIDLYSGSNGNIFNNVTISTTPSYYIIQEGGIYSGKAYNNTFENSLLNSTTSTQPFNLYNSSLIFINTTLNGSSTGVLNSYSFYNSINSTAPFFSILDLNSSALIQWFLNTRVQDSKGSAISNVTVNVTNSSGLIVQNVTDDYGYTGLNVLSQELLTNSSIYTYAPYTASAAFNGCASRVYSNTTQLTSSNLLFLTLQDLVRTLQLLSVSPSVYNIYKPKENISLTFEVFNPSCLSTSFNITVYTPQGSFNCNSSTNGYASVYVPCGSMNLSSYINTVNVTFTNLAGGWSAQPTFQNFTFYTSISNNIVVPDSNVLVILAFAFASFFIFKDPCGV